jgi:methyl-accepting chemotaxis protein
MHRPESFGDDLSKVRPIHVFANKNLTLLHGIEVGKYGISLRSILPIIYNGKHYSTLEVGTALEDVIKELQEVMDIKILLTLESSKLKISLLERLKKYNNKSSILFSSDLFNDLHPNLKNTSELTYKGHNYMLYKGIDLFSFNGDKVGQFFYAIDVTNELHEKNNYIILSSIITIILLFLVYIILHVNFSKIGSIVFSIRSFVRLYVETF